MVHGLYTVHDGWIAVKIPIVFYRTSTGNEPVRDWLRKLGRTDRNIIGQDLMRVQFRWPVGMPLCRPLGNGLWEVRSELSGNRIARVLFFAEDDRIGALHGFIKKTQKTPLDAITLANKRRMEMENDKGSKSKNKAKGKRQ
jgi:phage-related protein